MCNSRNSDKLQEHCEAAKNIYCMGNSRNTAEALMHYRKGSRNTRSSLEQKVHHGKAGTLQNSRNTRNTMEQEETAGTLWKRKNTEEQDEHYGNGGTARTLHNRRNTIG